MKIAFIIPGFGHSAKEKVYQQIALEFKKKGLKPKILDIPWKYHVMSDWVRLFEEEYQKVAEDEVYVLGFSYGAMIAFISSAKLNFKAQILCSLSPYFKEDLPNIRGWWKRAIGKRRVKDLENFSYKDLSKNVRCQTFIIKGSKEEYEVSESNERVIKYLKCPYEFLVAQDSPHDISHPEYLKVIKRVIEGL